MRKYDYSKSVVLISEEENFGLEIPRRYQNDSKSKSYDLTSLKDDYEWQVTYKFTSDFRPNYFNGKKYGADNMTYRRLYEILCKRFNNGVYFIDTYFNDVYPYTFKKDIDNYLNDLKERAMKDYVEMTEGVRLNAEGLIDKRYSSVYRGLGQFDSFLDSEVESEGETFAKLIKADIVRALEMGRIPLADPFVSSKTVMKRMETGLPPFPKFFASGEFINNVIVFCRLRRKQWQVQHYQPTQV